MTEYGFPFEIHTNFIRFYPAHLQSSISHLLTAVSLSCPIGARKV